MTKEIFMTTSTYLEELIIHILETNGPLLGSELKKQLQKSAEVTDSNARKIIQRTSDNGNILSTKPVSFQRGQFLYYLTTQNPLPNIKQILKEKRKGLNRVLQGLERHNGIASEYEIHKWASSITNPSFFPKNDTTQKIESELKHLSIIHTEEEYNKVKYVRTNSNLIVNKQIYFYRYRFEIINRILLLESINWLERTNMLAWKQTQLMDKNLKRVNYNGHLWDAVGYTYLFGYYQTEYANQEKGKIPSIAFIESLHHRNIYLEDIEGFCTRIEMQSARMKNYKAGSRILPILFYHSISKDAFDLAKSKGLLMLNIKDWLGHYSSPLIELLLSFPVKNRHTIDQCNDLISKIEMDGRELPLLLKELYIIKYCTSYTLRGWNCRRHVYYQYNDTEYLADWLMFDENDNPYLCFYTSKKLLGQDEENKIRSEIALFESIYNRLGFEEKEVGYMFFNEEGIK